MSRQDTTPEDATGDRELEPLVDEAKLRAYLEEHLPTDEADPAFSVQRLRAGKSNETFFVTWGQDEYVLRRPPRGAFLPTAHDVMREHRVLSALEGKGVRAPRPVIGCEDEDVIGAEFYLMEKIEGTVIRTELPEAYTAASNHEAIGTELIDALAELHNIAWEGTALEEIGYASGYIERQVSRWQDQWDRTRPRTEQVREVPELDWVGAWLEDQLPETPRTTVVHGDYKLDNVVYANTPPELVGILDWEMATLGDPLADLGYLMIFWREADDPEDATLGVEPTMTEQASFPTRADLVERYEKATGTDVTDLDWYKTLAIWKLAILLEGSYARHLAGKTDDPFFELMEHGVPMLARRAKKVATGEQPI